MFMAFFDFRLLSSHFWVRPRKDHHGVDLISDALPFGRLWYGEPDGLARPLDFIHMYGPIKTFGRYFAQIGEQLLLAGVLIPNHLSD